jgi:hypothetical protein
MSKPLMKALAVAMIVAAGSAVAQEREAALLAPSEGVVFTPRYEARPQSAPASEGHCILKVWVDDRATVMLRGSQIAVRTDSGSQARDQGSFCSGPLPTRVENFRIAHSNAPAGGRLVNLVAPSPRNNYTGQVSIDDPSNGGRTYVLDVWWNDADYRAPATPRVATNPGYGVDVEFRHNVRKEDLGSGRDRIRGGGTATHRDDTVRFGYECIVDDRRNQVVSSSYQLRGESSLR